MPQIAGLLFSLKSVALGRIDRGVLSKTDSAVELAFATRVQTITFPVHQVERIMLRSRRATACPVRSCKRKETAYVSCHVERSDQLQLAIVQVDAPEEGTAETDLTELLRPSLQGSARRPAHRAAAARKPPPPVRKTTHARSRASKTAH